MINNKCIINILNMLFTENKKKRLDKLDGKQDKSISKQN